MFLRISGILKIYRFRLWWNVDLREAKSMMFGLKWWIMAQKASPSWNDQHHLDYHVQQPNHDHDHRQCNHLHHPHHHHHCPHPPWSGHVSDGDAWVIRGDPLAPDLKSSNSSSLNRHLAWLDLSSLGTTCVTSLNFLCFFVNLAELFGVHCTSLCFRLRVNWTHP